MQHPLVFRATLTWIDWLGTVHVRYVQAQASAIISRGKEWFKDMTGGFLIQTGPSVSAPMKGR